MEKDKILFILGAGSSIGLGYPTGYEFCDRIIKNVNNHIIDLNKSDFPKNEMWY